MMSSADGFIRITPKDIQATPPTDLQLDVARTLDVFNHLQRAQAIGHVAPESLILRGSNIPDQIDIPIKAPGTSIFIPEWFAQTPFVQIVADHRFATSRFADKEMWSLVYEQRRIRPGHPARTAPVGPHLDDWMSTFLPESPARRVSTLYLAASDLPTVFYDGLGEFNLQAYRTAAALSDQAMNEADLGGEEDARRHFLAPVLKQESRKQFAAGDVVVFNGATPHEVAVLPRNHEPVLRGFALIHMSEGSFTASDVQRLNPALWADMLHPRHKRLAP